MSVAVRSIAAVFAAFLVLACMSDESVQANHERRLARARESLARSVAGLDRLEGADALVERARKYEKLFADEKSVIMSEFYGVTGVAYRNAVRAVEAAEHDRAAAGSAQMAVASAHRVRDVVEQYESSRLRVLQGGGGNIDVYTQAQVSGPRLATMVYLELSADYADEAEQTAYSTSPVRSTPTLEETDP